MLITPVHSPVTVVRRASPPLPLAKRVVVANCTREPGCADHADNLHVLLSNTQPPQIVGRRRRFAKNGRRWRSGDRWCG